MKIAFITNDISYYGASRSLRTLIKSLREVYNDSIEIHLIIPKRLMSQNDFDTVSEWFGVSKNQISEFPLPFWNNYKGHSKSLYSYLFNIKWKLSSNKLFRFLEKEKFDFVHLNSLTLLDVANMRFPMVLHVREVMNSSIKAGHIQNKLNKINKIVFIDEATSFALRDFKLPNACILNNPFSMKELHEVKTSDELQRLNRLCNDKVVFSLIGKVHKDKGVEFIINVFEKLKSDTRILLIKGGGDPKYINYLKSKATENVIFLDEGPDVENLYIVSDYILRGEDFPCIGRTTFEALYAGLGVVLPGTDKYYSENLSDYNKFKERINSYRPRNRQELLTLVEILPPIDKSHRELLSNTIDYVNHFIKFIKE